MKKIYLTKMIMSLMLGFFGLANVNAQVYELSLDNVIVWDGAAGNPNSYDPATRTITFTQDWSGGAGWDVTGMDMSAYNRVTVEFENAQGGYVRITSEYNDGGGWIESGTDNPCMLTNQLDVSRISTLFRIGLGVNGTNGVGRQVVLKRAYFWYEAPPSPLALSIDKLNFFATDGGPNECAASYDPTTHTITYSNGQWHRGGWNFEPQGGLTVPAGMNRIYLNLGATSFSSGELQFDVEYMDGTKPAAGGGNGGGNQYFAGAKQVWWDVEAGKTIKLVTLKSQNEGTVVLTDANFAYIAPPAPIDYTINNVNFYESGSSYDLGSHTITYNGAWSRVGWNFNVEGVQDGLDVSAYKQVFLEFDASAMVDGTDHYSLKKLQFDVTYMDGSQETISGGGDPSALNEYRVDATKVWWTLSDNTKKIKLITLKSEAPGTVVLTNAYFTSNIVTLPDLTVANVRWDPVNPKAGDEVTFYAAIKNNGGYASPANTPHAVAFLVNGVPVTLSDGFQGSISAGGIQEVTANTTWICGNDATYDIQAWVNGGEDIPESNYDNNYSSPYTLSINTGEIPPIDYSLNNLNFFATDGGEDPTAAFYDVATHTIIFNNNWSRAGWNFEPQGGLDASGYDRVVLEFNASQLPAGSDGLAKLQFDVTYMDGTTETLSGGGDTYANEYRADVTQVWWDLTNNANSPIKLITLKSEVPGTVVLTNAYFANSVVADTIDLIITNIRWEPANPKPGDQVTFFATIKNIGNVSTPTGIKHGVAFSVNGVVKSWSDGFFGPIPAGGEVEVSSRMAGSTGALWLVPTGSTTYTIKAEVNDQKEITELNYTNDTFSAVLSVATGIKEIPAGSGNVYYTAGSLQVINYPASAILRVYNLDGRSISGYLSVPEAKSVNLSSGIYVVEVRSEGKTFIHKVIVK